MTSAGGIRPTAADGGELLSVAFGPADVARLRVLVDGQARLTGLVARRRGDFVVAVDAVATNAIQHGGGRGELLLIRALGALECTIADRGPGFSPDVIPELAPGINGYRRGRGLWLARLLTDTFEVAPGGEGARVRFTMRLA